MHASRHQRTHTSTHTQAHTRTENEKPDLFEIVQPTQKDTRIYLHWHTSLPPAPLQTPSPPPGCRIPLPASLHTIRRHGSMRRLIAFYAHPPRSLCSFSRSRVLCGQGRDHSFHVRIVSRLHTHTRTHQPTNPYTDDAGNALSTHRQRDLVVPCARSTARRMVGWRTAHEERAPVVLRPHVLPTLYHRPHVG
jgi:hypothetical protein